VKLSNIIESKRGTVATTETAGLNEVKTTGTAVTTDGVKNRQVDDALEKTKDLINPDFKSWYAKRCIEIGYGRYMGLAEDARRGRSPLKLFSYLLRRA
jgi:hypothetical protein